MEDLNKSLGLKDKPNPSAEHVQTDESFLVIVSYILLGGGLLGFILLFLLAFDNGSWLMGFYAIGVLVSSIGTYALFKVIANISNSLKEIAKK